MRVRVVTRSLIGYWDSNIVRINYITDSINKFVLIELALVQPKVLNLV